MNPAETRQRAEEPACYRHEKPAKGTGCSEKACTKKKLHKKGCRAQDSPAPCSLFFMYQYMPVHKQPAQIDQEALQAVQSQFLPVPASPAAEASRLQSRRRCKELLLNNL